MTFKLFCYSSRENKTTIAVLQMIYMFVLVDKYFKLTITELLKHTEKNVEKVRKGEYFQGGLESIKNQMDTLKLKTI